jgi:acetyl-CoA carboxylase biotin carboxyl carrier protein
MQLAQIKAFIDAMASSDLAELEVSKDGWTLRLVREAGRHAPARPAANPPPAQRPCRDEAEAGEGRAQAPPPAASEICAPLSGVVYLQPAPDRPPFVVAGQTIKAGAAVCVIEAMKTMNEIRAERDGTIEVILVASETLVDAGQPLMRFA